MQAVILAAGMATRLKPLTDDTPKCLLLLDDKPIIYYMLNNLKNQGIKELVVVTGFERAKIEDYIQGHFPELTVKFIYNKDFAATNNAYSLLLAKESIKGEFILLDSDIVFHEEILALLKKFPERPALAVERHACGEEEIKVTVDSKQRIGAINKQVNPTAAWGESIGIEIFSAAAKEKLFQVLEKRIRQEKRVNEYYEASFEEMISDGFPFYAVDTSAYPAMEVDFSEDLEAARKMEQQIKASTGHK